MTKFGQKKFLRINDYNIYNNNKKFGRFFRILKI